MAEEEIIEERVVRQRQITKERLRNMLQDLEEYNFRDEEGRPLELQEDVAALRDDLGLGYPDEEAIS